MNECEERKEHLWYLEKNVWLFPFVPIPRCSPPPPPSLQPFYRQPTSQQPRFLVFVLQLPIRHQSVRRIRVR